MSKRIFDKYWREKNSESNYNPLTPMDDESKYFKEELEELVRNREWNLDEFEKIECLNNLISEMQDDYDRHEEEMYPNDMDEDEGFLGHDPEVEGRVDAPYYANFGKKKSSSKDYYVVPKKKK